MSAELRLLPSICLLKCWRINTADTLLSWHVWSKGLANSIHVLLGLSANPLRVCEEVHTELYKTSEGLPSKIASGDISAFLYMPKELQQSQFLSNPGGHQCHVSKAWKDNSLLVRSVRAELGFWSPRKRPLSSFHQPYLGKTWRQPLCEWEHISALGLHSPRSRKNTVPCIPAGPKSCLVRKMAWSWYSACSGSRRCCVLAHRHTCSRLRDGLPRSIRLMDWIKRPGKNHLSFEKYLLCTRVRIWNHKWLLVALKGPACDI